MIGGIYCEASLGPVYSDNGTLMSVKQAMQRLFGSSNILPKGETIDEQIINYWYKDVSGKMAKILSSWSAPSNRGYYNRTVDLTRSICMGIYHKGTLKRMYRFTGGHREKGLFVPSDLGTNTSSSATFRMEMLAKANHPDPAARAKQFLEGYDLIYKKGFSIVIAATMPYAARLEHDGNIGGKYHGYRLPVLKLIINRILSGVYDFNNRESGVFYGYVFESTGLYHNTMAI